MDIGSTSINGVDKKEGVSELYLTEESKERRNESK